MIEWLKRHEELLRHPLVLALVGFVLTGWLGTWITDRLHRQEAEQTVAAARRERGIAAIQDIAELINERRTRAVMIASAIKRGSPDEVRARKAAYDEVYVRWNMKEDSILNQMQDFLKLAMPDSNPAHISAYASGFRTALTSEHAVNSRTGKQRADRSQGGLLSRMDDCITSAFDDYRRSDFQNAEPAKATLAQCRLNDLDDRMIDCTHLLTEQLYGVINRLGTPEAARVSDAAMSQNTAAMRAGCSLPE